MKRAYDYAHEGRALEKARAIRANDPEGTFSEGIATGVAFGAPIGAAVGAMRAGRGRRVGGALRGGGIGSLVGITLGALGTVVGNADIADAKDVMSMPPDERRDLMRARARSSGKIYDSIDRDMKHRELVGAIQEKNAAIGFLKEVMASSQPPARSP